MHRWLCLSVVVAAGCTNEIGTLRWELHETVGSFARVSWRQSGAAEAHVEYSVDDGVWMSTPTIDARSGINETLLVGIPYGEQARWRVVLDNGLSREGKLIETEPVPENLPLGRIVQAEPDAWLGGGQFLLTSISQNGGGWGTPGPFYAMIVDRKGRPVWTRRTRQSGQWTLYATVARSGDHLLLDEFSNFGGGDPVLVRTYLDAPIDEMVIPGFHHAFVEMPDGSVVWGSRGHGGGEALVQKSFGSDDETILWTCEDDWGPGFDEGCRSSNCVYYDDDRDSFLISFYSNETVVEIDGASGSTLWWAGEVDGGFTFDPPESQFVWQHGVTWTDAGTLLLSTHEFGGAERTNEAREYTVDFDEGVLTEIWSYDSLAFANTNGDTWRLPNGNTLHTLGSASLIKEVDTTGDVVWHLDYNEAGENRLTGRSEWISDLYSLLSPDAQ